jgi:hypothetical protein
MNFNFIINLKYGPRPLPSVSLPIHYSLALAILLTAQVQFITISGTHPHHCCTIVTPHNADQVSALLPRNAHPALNGELYTRKHDVTITHLIRIFTVFMWPTSATWYQVWKYRLLHSGMWCRLVWKNVTEGSKQVSAYIFKAEDSRWWAPRCLVGDVSTY